MSQSVKFVALGFLIGLWHLGCLPTLVYAQPSGHETFLSSHEGKIGGGLIIRPELRTGGAGCETEPNRSSICSGGDGYDLDSYINELEGIFNGSVTLVTQIITNEKPFDNIPGIEDESFSNKFSHRPALHDIRDKLIGLKERFIRLNDSIPFVDFEDSKTYNSLIYGRAIEHGLFPSAKDSILVNKLRACVRDWQKSFLRYISETRKIELQASLKSQNRNQIYVISEFADHAGLCDPTHEECECLGAVQDYFQGHPWAQDIFFVQDNGDYKLRSSFHYDSLKAKYSDILAEKVADRCAIGHDSMSRLEVAGGNMAANSSLIFIGRDALADYTDSHKPGHTERLTALGLDASADQDAITSAIDDLTGRKTIWVGTQTKHNRGWYRDPEREFNQPIYHIDLFFTPLKWAGTSQDQSKDTLYYLLAVPDSAHIQMHLFRGYSSEGKMKSAKTQTALLSDWIRATADDVDAQLKKVGVTGKRIIIPLPLQFRTDRSVPAIEKYWAFCNGLVEEQDGHSTYYIPEYTCDMEDDSVRELYETAKHTIGKFTEVRPIKGVYGDHYALHCSFLVTKRE